MYYIRPKCKLKRDQHSITIRTSEITLSEFQNLVENTGC